MNGSNNPAPPAEANKIAPPLPAQTVVIPRSDILDAPNESDRYLGQTIDQKYSLEVLLGSGGMGRVYSGIHLGTGRRVAVKLILPEFVDVPAFLERFRREARAAGQLRHPNIVDVTDFGIASDGQAPVAYLVMEYLDGSTLHDALTEDQPIPVSLAVEILGQVCSAVHAAHRSGVVHRDLKPANIWLEPNPLGGYRVKVLDFGLAKIGLESGADMESPLGENMSDRERTSRFSNGPALTQVGHVMGTPAYMSPEQCRGEPADARSDIYSLGIVAYLLFSGGVPFRGEDDSVLRAHQVEHPVPLRSRCKWVPRGISRAVEMALQKIPEHRPESALAFANLLRSGAETIWTLFRRAVSLYSEYFPEIVKLSLWAHVPVFLVAALKIGLIALVGTSVSTTSPSLSVGIGLLGAAATFLSSSMISGLVAVVVIQLAAAPFQPINLRSVFQVLRTRWVPFFCTAILATLLIVIGFVLMVVPGMVALVAFSLWAPVVLLEGKPNWEALRRSRQLAARSWMIATTAVLFHFATPVVLGAMFNGLIPSIPGSGQSFSSSLAAELKSLGSVFVLPLVSIVVALAFIKLRQIGGQDVPVSGCVEDGTGAGGR